VLAPGASFPDIEVTDQDPLQVAHHRILNDLLKSAKDDSEKEFLQIELKTLTTTLS
jgi:hypothetical protein